jgi:ABC-type transporter Mla maintaining outer membrane lipid asymmetry ATPase subunit MlaF
VKGQDTLSVTLDPSIVLDEATLGQTPPSAGTIVMVIFTVASSKQTLPMTGTMVLASALGAAPAPKPLKKKKLGVKKSAL